MDNPQDTNEAAEYNPMADGELHDDGPWIVSDDGRGIQSDDFTHDVILRVTGDFYDDAQRKAYADNLAVKLHSGLTVAHYERKRLLGEIDRLRRITTRTHDMLLRGENDDLLLDMLQTAWRAPNIQCEQRPSTNTTKETT